jgi:hypothetical protein
MLCSNLANIFKDSKTITLTNISPYPSVANLGFSFKVKNQTQVLLTAQNSQQEFSGQITTFSM